ncbi:uncharacterized protein L201_003145 [Kwoniella dendrophila CBS 6074]|uniref:Uncharacterized protein n=1 Tax=Kwoniella dendrophila CBS 6074 TaxID=1295534 RepID=A0AAX4JTU2_9TREE
MRYSQIQSVAEKKQSMRTNADRLKVLWELSNSSTNWESFEAKFDDESIGPLSTENPQDSTEELSTSGHGKTEIVNQQASVITSTSTSCPLIIMPTSTRERPSFLKSLRSLFGSSDEASINM